MPSRVYTSKMLMNRRLGCAHVRQTSQFPKGELKSKSKQFVISAEMFWLAYGGADSSTLSQYTDSQFTYCRPKDYIAKKNLKTHSHTHTHTHTHTYTHTHTHTHTQTTNTTTYGHEDERMNLQFWDFVDM